MSFALLAAATCAIIICITIANGQARYGPLDTSLLTQQPLTTRIIDRDGSAVSALHGVENRVAIAIGSVPLHVRQAFFAAEDLRFPDHPGVDVVRIFGAALHDVKTGSLSQGASTITQQLIKLTHLSEEKSFTRKIYEAWLAIQLESRYSKDDILEMYLNTVFFGAGAYGIESASQVYFAKPTQSLTIAEAALLAGVLKSPTRYAPHRNPEDSLTRRNLIIGNMQEAGFISATQASAAKAEPLTLAEARDPYPYGWYIDRVINEATDALGIDADTLNAGGYAIYTALDTRMQQHAEALAADPANLPPAADDRTMPEIALAAVIPATGEMPALIGGGLHTARRTHNRATDMRRQPGSTLKPLAVYAPAIEELGFHPTTFVDDAPYDFSGWIPRDFNDQSLGRITLRTAIAKSQNIPAVHTLSELGIDSARDALTRFGISLDAQDAYLPLALGAMTYGATPLEMAGAYAAIANGGTYIQPHAILRIVDRNGREVYAFDRDAAKTRVVSAETAYLLTDMLRSAALWGTGKAIGALDYPTAAKTGTIGQSGIDNASVGNKDIWTCAYTPTLTLSVWMCFDNPSSERAIPTHLTGGSLPARLATAFLGEVQPMGGGSFVVPPTLRHVEIDTYTLANEERVVLATPLTPTEYRGDEWFPLSRIPRESSAFWARPTAPLAFGVTQGKDGWPLISLTVAQSSARYRIYRRSGDETPVEIGWLEGQPGDVKTLLDSHAERSQTHHYTVVPEHRLIEQLGAAGLGLTSFPVAYTVPPTRLPGVIDDFNNLPDLDELLGLPELEETGEKTDEKTPAPVDDAEHSADENMPIPVHPSPTPALPLDWLAP